MNIPGLADLQVNGYKGIDFSSFDLTPDGFVYACHELIRNGTTVFLPTLITSPVELYRRNLPLIIQTIKDHNLQENIPGLHLEGPFISGQDGARGAHQKEYVKNPDVKLLDDFIQWAENQIKLITIAPELPGAVSFCSYAAGKGIVVSAGHSLATFNELRNASENGLKAFTHIGNGIPKMVNRQNNPIMAAFLNDDVTAMIITDGFHTLPDFIKLVLKIKTVDKTIIVSDQSPVAGLKPGKYHVPGNNIILESSGYLYNPDTGSMVGSSRTLLECANYMLSSGLASIHEVIRLCYSNPLGLINCKAAPASTLVYDKKENRICLEGTVSAL